MNGEATLNVGWVSYGYSKGDAGYEWTLRFSHKPMVITGTRLYKTKRTARQAAIREVAGIGLTVSTKE